MFQSVARSALLLIGLFLVAACAPKSQELQAVSEFEVGHRPAPSAKAQLEVILATGTGGSVTPVYSDVAFFPVTRADAFDSSQLPPAVRHHDTEPDLSGIDFDSQFAFLVAHPRSNSSYSALKSGQSAMYFSSAEVSYPEDRVLIHLSAGRLGDLDPMTALTARWGGRIYPVERRGRNQVEVRIDEHSYMYSLEDGGLQATASRARR